VGAAFIATARFVNERICGIISILWKYIPWCRNIISAKLPLAATGSAQLVIAVAEGAAGGPFSAVSARFQSVCILLAMYTKG
jgi:hypothetical protein